MNKTTRKKLSEIIDELQPLKETLEELADEEQDKADNMPENMQSSEKHDQCLLKRLEFINDFR